LSLVTREKKLKWLLTLVAVTILAGSLLPTYALEIKIKTETQSIPEIEDPTPGYWETSEYMIGTITLDVIFLESNGSIDPETEDWTQFEMSNVMRKIKSALDWWEGQAPFVRFMPLPPPPPAGYIPVPTSYEPINRNVSDRGLWVSEAMSYLGYTTGDNITQVRNYVNDLRDSTGADWAFIMFMVDSSNDPDGVTPDGYFAYASNLGELYLVMTYDNDGWGIKDMDRVCAHEIAHMFWATDEYNNVTEYCGYLNAVDIEGSGGLMEVNDWSLSGAPHGLNGTWGQIGWRDSDSDGIPDIVDTFPEIILKSDSTNSTTNTTITFTGTTFVVPYPNMNPYTWNPVEYRNVTINKIEMIEFRIDSGDWIPVYNVSGVLGTDAIKNFTFYTPQLSLGNHTIEVRATNQWGNSGYANQTVTIQEVIHDVAITSLNPYKTILPNNTLTSINVTAENQGDVTEDFNVTLFYDSTQIGTQTLTLLAEQSTVLTFEWTTPTEPGNYTIRAEANQVPGETDLTDNVFVFGNITVTIQVFLPTDLNQDGIVNIADVSIVAVAYGTKEGDENYNSIADLDDNKQINIVDVSLVALDYGKTV